MLRVQSERTENSRLDLSNRKAILLARIADRIDTQKLSSSELRLLDPSLSRKQVSRLRDRDSTVCSLTRLEGLAAALGVGDVVRECAA